MVKIQQIRSESEIDIYEAYRYNEYNEDFEIKSIEGYTVKLKMLHLDGYAPIIRGKVVEGEIAEKYWNTLIYNVLKPLNLDFINTTKLNVLPDGLTSMDKAHKVANNFINGSKHFDVNALEELLNMKSL